MTPDEAMTVLRLVKLKHPSNYKARIHLAWISGDYASHQLSAWQSDLQRMRNSLGPDWLDSTRP
jgi:hypothetical protein